VRGIFDGELVALDEHGKPSFPLICECVLQRHRKVALTYMVFDVLSVDGEPVTRLPYVQRRAILDDLNLNGPSWRIPDAFDDGEALWHAVCEHELEGVVAKKRTGRYLSGDRGWIKTKNRDYWRWAMEREGALKARRPRAFI
jgi:bifunctional non-homologous end joining protein LigD